MKIGDLVKPFTPMIHLYSSLSMDLDEKKKVEFFQNSIGIILNVVKINATSRCRVLSPVGTGWTNSLLLELV